MQLAGIVQLPTETLHVIVQNALQESVQENAWVHLAGVCSAFRHAVVSIHPLTAHLSVGHRDFQQRLAALEKLQLGLQSMTLLLGRTSWLTEDEYARVSANFSVLNTGRPFINMQHLQGTLHHLSIVSLSRHMWYAQWGKITTHLQPPLTTPIHTHPAGCVTCPTLPAAAHPSNTSTSPLHLAVCRRNSPPLPPTCLV